MISRRSLLKWLPVSFFVLGRVVAAKASSPTEVVGVDFVNRKITLSGSYRNCHFFGCTILSGGGPIDIWMTDCVISNCIIEPGFNIHGSNNAMVCCHMYDPQARDDFGAAAGRCHLHFGEIATMQGKL